MPGRQRCAAPAGRYQEHRVSALISGVEIAIELNLVTLTIITSYRSLKGDRPSGERSRLINPENSVFHPVRTTTAVTLPLTTCVPAKIAFVRSISGAVAETSTSSLEDGNDSPVNADWSTKRSFD